MCLSKITMRKRGAIQRFMKRYLNVDTNRYRAYKAFRVSKVENKPHSYYVRSFLCPDNGPIGIDQSLRAVPALVTAGRHVEGRLSDEVYTAGYHSFLTRAQCKQWLKDNNTSKYEAIVVPVTIDLPYVVGEHDRKAQICVVSEFMSADRDVLLAEIQESIDVAATDVVAYA